jgi:hypothetical protein
MSAHIAKTRARSSLAAFARSVSCETGEPPKSQATHIGFMDRIEANTESNVT